MLNRQLLITIYVVSGLLLSGGCGRLFSDKDPAYQTGNESSYNSDLLLAKEALKRIEAIFPNHPSNEDIGTQHQIARKFEMDKV